MNRARETAKPKKLAWSKIMMIVMIIICVQIIVFSEWIMWLYADLSSLYALVGIAAALAASVWAYCDKSKAENTKGGIVYDSALGLPNAPKPENPEEAEG